MTEEIIKPDFPRIVRDNTKTNQLVFQDASSIIASVLPPQLGTDPLLRALGKYDLKKLSKISELERIWIAYFLLLEEYEGGEYSTNFCENMLALSSSVGGFNSQLIVEMQKAVSGGKENAVRRDVRSFVEKHFTRRNRPKYEYVVEGDRQ